MKPDIYDIAVPNKALLFVVSATAERMAAISKALQQIGAMEVGPQMFVVSSASDIAEQARNAVGEIFDGESIYVVRQNGGQLSHQVIVRPRTEGGIVVR